MRISVLSLLIYCLPFGELHAAALLYHFDGVVNGTSGAGSDIFVTEHAIVPSVTTVSYIFEVDFQRNSGSFTTPVQTVEYFYCDLLGSGIALELLGGIFPGEANEGANIDFVSFQDTGQLRGSNVVKIFTNENETPDWRVEEWTVGQSFRFSDGTRPEWSENFIALYGEVTLTSIEPVPEPSVSGLAMVALIAGFLGLRRRNQTAQQERRPRQRPKLERR